MTAPEEDDLRAQVTELRDMVHKMHAALMEASPGGGMPFIQRVNAVIETAERGEWVVRTAWRLILSAGALAAAVASIRHLMSSSKGP